MAHALLDRVQLGVELHFPLPAADHAAALARALKPGGSRNGVLKLKDFELLLASGTTVSFDRT